MGRHRGTAVGLLPALLAVACSEPPTLPVSGAHPVAQGAVVQVLEVTTSVDAGVGRFEIASRLRNTGADPINVRVRSCHLRASDVRGEGVGLVIEEPLVLCASEARRLTLFPGESTDPLTLGGRATPGSVHAIEVRHLVGPEHWEPLALRIE